jgi:hypothetical protein
MFVDRRHRMAALQRVAQCADRLVVAAGIVE